MARAMRLLVPLALLGGLCFVAPVRPGVPRPRLVRAERVRREAFTAPAVPLVGAALLVTAGAALLNTEVGDLGRPKNHINKSIVEFNTLSCLYKYINRVGWEGADPAYWHIARSELQRQASNDAIKELLQKYTKIQIVKVTPDAWAKNQLISLKV